MGLEQRLVDLALIDRHVLLDADADDLGPLDSDFLRQLLGGEMVGHVAPLVARLDYRKPCCLTKKPAALDAPAGGRLRSARGDRHLYAARPFLSLLIPER